MGRETVRLRLRPESTAQDWFLLAQPLRWARLHTADVDSVALDFFLDRRPVPQQAMPKTDLISEPIPARNDASKLQVANPEEKT